MPQSLANVLIHVVFSTKDRRPWLTDEHRIDLHAYIGTILSRSENAAVRVGGTADHLHIALYLSREERISHLVQQLKIASSKWLKLRSPELARFTWQRGYAVFSVSPTQRQVLVEYIDRQVEHHRKSSYQDELRALFAKCGIQYDERFVWD